VPDCLKEELSQEVEDCERQNCAHILAIRLHRRLKEKKRKPACDNLAINCIINTPQRHISLSQHDDSELTQIAHLGVHATTLLDLIHHSTRPTYINIYSVTWISPSSYIWHGVVRVWIKKLPYCTHGKILH